MKVEILQENLSTYLSLALKFISPKTQLPILSSFLFESKKEGLLKITASDMESFIILYVGARVEEEGEVAVSAKVFSDFVFSLPAGKIYIEKKKEELSVLSGKSRASIGLFPVSEFPKTEEVSSGKNVFKIDKVLFKNIFSLFPFASSQDISRPSMTGIYFDRDRESLCVVATDGFRLSLLEKREREDGELFSFNVSSKIIEEVGKISSVKKEEVFVFLNNREKIVFFKTEDVEIGARLIEGQYPPYRKIIPAVCPFRFVVDRADFLRTVRAASIFSKDSGSVIKLFFAKNVLKISSQTAGVGGYENEIDCVQEGEDIGVSFNFKYLLDILSRFSGKEVVFETEGEGKPCVFREKESPGFLHLIMPVKNS